ncbi:hypothetical protein ABW19_dt0206608 [Dactylella cylindrospora]|nr:hypothetical protein ABW19_dt0206608 [Dactylella cylindrospora]
MFRKYISIAPFVCTVVLVPVDAALPPLDCPNNLPNVNLWSSASSTKFLGRLDNYLRDLSGTEWFGSFTKYLPEQTKAIYDALSPIEYPPPNQRKPTIPLPVGSMAFLYQTIVSDNIQCYAQDGPSKLMLSMITLDEALASPDPPVESYNRHNQEERFTRERSTEFDLRHRFQYINLDMAYALKGAMDGHLDQLDQIIPYAKEVYPQNEVERLVDMIDWWTFAAQTVSRVILLVSSAEAALREPRPIYKTSDFTPWLDLERKGWEPRVRK